jgi:carboxylesterase type B
MVFVALNYRLGALGFLSGPEVKKNGDLNVGLLDQRLALEWVQVSVRSLLFPSW